MVVSECSSVLCCRRITGVVSSKNFVGLTGVVMDWVAQNLPYFHGFAVCVLFKKNRSRYFLANERPPFTRKKQALKTGNKLKKAAHTAKKLRMIAT
jgi:hypothetical protein